MRLLLLGPPASGKGTQAKKLLQHYGWPQISTGDIFRHAYQQKSELGIQAHDNYWGKGLLVPDEITNTLAFQRLQKNDGQNGYILDGYPRTIGQAQALETFFQEQQELKGLKAVRKLDRAIYFACSEEVLVGRATSRLICKDCGTIYGQEILPQQEGHCDRCPGMVYRRADDQEEVVRERLREYQRQTAPLIGFYQHKGLLTEINAGLNVEQVFSRLQQIIEWRC